MLKGVWKTFGGSFVAELHDGGGRGTHSSGHLEVCVCAWGGGGLSVPTSISPLFKSPSTGYRGSIGGRSPTPAFFLN